MAFVDDFTNGTGSGQNLNARTGWTLTDGTAANAYVSAGGTALNSNPAGEAGYTCTSQGSANHYTEAVVLGQEGFVCIRMTDSQNFIGFRHNGSAWQVYKRVGGTFTQLGSDFSAASPSGETCRLTANGSAITFTINGVLRCLGAGVTETDHSTVQTQGVVSRNIAVIPWLDSFTASGLGTNGTASGVTFLVTASLIVGSAFSGTGASAPGVTYTPVASIVAGSAAGNAGGTLQFQAAGMEFGRRTGLGISTFALDTSQAYRYTVHADGLVLGAALITSSVINTDAAGKLPNLTSGSLFAGTTYRIVAVRQADGEAATFRMVAA